MSEHESRPIGAIEVPSGAQAEAADNERGGLSPIVKVAIVFTMLGVFLIALMVG